MKLIRVDINGYKRLVDTHISVDEDVIAIVGPNEAGKSSLLNAIASLDNHDNFDRYDLTRGINHPGNKHIVTALFLLDNNERELINETGGVGNPRWYYLAKKRSNGNLIHWVEPEIKRDKRPRLLAQERLQKVLNNSRLVEILDWSFGKDKPQNLKDMLVTLKGDLSVKNENLPSTVLDNMQNSIDALQLRGEEVSVSYSRQIEKTRKLLQDALKAEKENHPEDELLEKLSERTPKFLLFGDEERNLLSEYGSDVLKSPPAALENVLRLAEVNMSSLRDAIHNGDHALRATIQQRANDALRHKFQEAWGQSPISIQLFFEPEFIRIMIDASNELSLIAERSDGLRAFVALFAYTSIKSGSVPPILLVDEAESHLHYDAQADLVTVFEGQQSAAKVIYTTHSAGCLPSDLGTGIRVVTPILDQNNQITQYSEIRNSFWDEGAGFSPLMMAMGASVLALVPARRALIAEGAVDMFLLPSMFREAVNKRNLGFQVAPGIASVAPNEIKSLELEAPKVAYLVDGDAGGDIHKRRLISSGISTEAIAQLSKGCALEDYIADDIFIEAVNEELRRSNGEGFEIKPEDFGEGARFIYVQNWCNNKSIKTPSKIKVALYIISKRRETKIVADKYADSLRTLYATIVNILNA